MKKKNLNGVSEWLLFIAISEEFSSENKKLFERKDDGIVIFVLGFYDVLCHLQKYFPLSSIFTVVARWNN